VDGGDRRRDAYRVFTPFWRTLRSIGTPQAPPALADRLDAQPGADGWAAAIARRRSSTTRPPARERSPPTTRCGSPNPA